MKATARVLGASVTGSMKKVRQKLQRCGIGRCEEWLARCGRPRFGRCCAAASLGQKRFPCKLEFRIGADGNIGTLLTATRLRWPRSGGFQISFLATLWRGRADRRKLLPAISAGAGYGGTAQSKLLDTRTGWQIGRGSTQGHKNCCEFFDDPQPTSTRRRTVCGR